jgi:hypothetical protein
MEPEPPPAAPEPHPAATASGVCPKCGHRAVDEHDPLIAENHCPKCGVVPEKYLARMAAGLETPSVGSAAEADYEPAGDDPPAGVKTRWAALIRTLLILAVLAGLCQAPLTIFQDYREKNVAIQRIVSDGQRFQSIPTYSHSLTFWIQTGVAAVLILVALMLYPMIRGTTWGEHRMGLLVVRRYDGADAHPLQRSLRLVGHLVNAILLGLPYLICYLSEDRLDLADLLSGTKTVQGRPRPRRPILVALRPLIVLAVVVGINWWLLRFQAQPPAMDPQRIETRLLQLGDLMDAERQLRGEVDHIQTCAQLVQAQRGALSFTEERKLHFFCQNPELRIDVGVWGYRIWYETGDDRAMVLRQGENEVELADLEELIRHNIYYGR